MTDNWNPFSDAPQDKAKEDGAEAERGSEGGRIVRDEEHVLGARITLEKECEIAPYAITCGIYGWMMHTCYLSEEDKAVEQYEAMKAELSDLLGRAEALASDGEEQRALLMEGCEKLVERFLT
jgi:hypothetical protein